MKKQKVKIVGQAGAGAQNVKGQTLAIGKHPGMKKAMAAHTKEAKQVCKTC